MAYTTIDKGSSYFNTSLWNGNNSTQSITGVGFAPDCVWIKCRSLTFDHQRYDTVRGANQVLNQTTAVEGTQTGGLTSFDSDGFTLGSNARNNRTGDTYLSFNWLAGGTASSNTDGSITSSVSASTVAGMSIVSYTGTGSALTCGHGLGAVPRMIIVKDRDASANWNTYHAEVGNAKTIQLNLATAESATSSWNSTTPTSSVFSLGAVSAVNTSGNDYIAYCFAEKKGYSKIGTYTGNGNADGTFVYTGFKPSMVIWKSTSGAYNWVVSNNEVNTFNDVDKYLLPNTNGAEATLTLADFVSNGFKIRTTNAALNNSSDSYIYMAFSENPFTTSTGIPVTAR